ncbi:MAG: putative quinol monooxygenase [Altererythrobacter sp.]
MIQIVGTVRIPAGSIDAARPAMERMLAASRAEPGCLRYSYAVDVLDEGLVHVVEAWADRDALAAHFQTPHMAEWRAAFAALGISDRDLRLYETDEGEPI